MTLKFSQGSVTMLPKMANHQEVRVKLTNAQLNKLKSTINMRRVQHEE